MLFAVILAVKFACLELSEVVRECGLWRLLGDVAAGDLLDC